MEDRYAELLKAAQEQAQVTRKYREDPDAQGAWGMYHGATDNLYDLIERETHEDPDFLVKALTPDPQLQADAQLMACHIQCWTPDLNTQTPEDVAETKAAILAAVERNIPPEGRQPD